MESLGNDDVSPLNSPKYEMVRDDVKQKMPEGIAWVNFVTFTAPLYFYCCAFRLFSLLAEGCTITDICLQFISVLTYSLFTNFPFHFQILSPAVKMNCM